MNKFVLLLFFHATICTGAYLNFSNDANDVFEGDIKGITFENIQKFINRNAESNASVASYMIKPWSSNLIPFKFSEISFTGRAKRGYVRDAMRDIESKTCVKFVYRSDEEDYIEIISDTGCYSNVGRIGGRQELSLGPNCLDQNTILHELLHAIGFLHEQSRSDRDDFITVLFANMPHYWQKSFRKYDQSLLVTTQNTSYDLKSVMHYPQVVSGVPVISTRNGTVIQSNGLSETDIKEINLLFNCSTNSYTQKPTMSPWRCRQNEFYCGRVLRLLDYRNVLFDDALYQCDENGEANYHMQCGIGKCIDNLGYGSYCSCISDALYCGHELFRMNRMNNLQNHSLYFCSGGSNLDYRDTCTNYCSYSESRSFCRAVKPDPCEPNRFYCGYELADIGHTGASPNVLYKCGVSGAGYYVKKCHSGCLMGGKISYCDSGKNARPLNAVKKKRF